MARVRLLVVAAALAAGLHASPAAHEIPRSVTVHAFVRADAGRLRVLVRVPLAAMRDIDFPQRGSFLDLARMDPGMRDGVERWILPDLQMVADGRLLPRPAVVAARVSLPSDRSFESFDSALANLHGPPLPEDVQLPREQAMLDVLLEYPLDRQHAELSIRPAFQRLGVDVLTSLRYLARGGIRAFELRGDPGLVRLDPRWHHAAARFVSAGFFHILDGRDHLLFLACLVIPLRRLRPLALVVTSFTAAHSMTLIAAALGLAPSGAWFPALVETLVAASILYMAIENIVAAPAVSRRCAVAFAFGLVHGFGFSFALRESLQFAGSHLLASLLSFNLGVELGQLLVLAALVPALQLTFRFVAAERPGTIVLSVVIAHTAWHWMADRWETLRQLELPAIDLSVLLALTRLLLGVVAVAALGWLVRRTLAPPRRREKGDGHTYSLHSAD